RAVGSAVGALPDRDWLLAARLDDDHHLPAWAAADTGHVLVLCSLGVPGGCRPARPIRRGITLVPRGVLPRHIDVPASRRPVVAASRRPGGPGASLAPRRCTGDAGCGSLACAPR